jgi:hypothetical protein
MRLMVSSRRDGPYQFKMKLSSSFSDWIIVNHNKQ